MSDDPYGQAELLDGLVPRLLGLERLRERRTRPEFSGSGPVVHVSGGRASGKTALLDALYHSYNGRLPLARADLAAPGFGDNALAGLSLEETASASPVTHLLFLLRHMLSRRSRGAALGFPRLSLGLLVATAWVPDDSGQGLAPAQLLDAQRRLRDFIWHAPAAPRDRRQLLRTWLTALTENLPLVLPGLDSLVRASLDTAEELLLSHRTRGPLRWWGERLAGLGDAIDRLFAFVIDFQTPGASRREAEEHLVRAFLADIDECYGFLQLRNWTSLPLVLLDNVHAEPGPRFLRLLVSGYAAAQAGGEDPVHPVVVGTELGAAGEGTPFGEVGRATPWAPPERRRQQREPEAWVLRLGINQVREDGVRAMLRGALGAARYPADLDRPIARLSGGRAGCARALVDAAVARLRIGGLAPGLTGAELLALPAARLGGDEAPAEGPPSVADHLLELLLPGQMRVRREDSTLVAAALGEAAARRLLSELGVPKPQDDEDAKRRLQLVKGEVTGPHWNRDPWPATAGQAGPAARDPVVGDRALRILLLHRLARLDAVAAQAELTGTGDPLAAPSGTSAALWHHTLARGDAEGAVRGLHHLYTRLAPGAWLAVVNVVCAAPHPLAPPPPPPGPPGPAPPCPACAGNDPVHRAIGRLTRCVWRLSDPLTLTPAREDLDEVYSALDRLHGGHEADQNVFLNAASAWRSHLRDGTQAPDLPIPQPETPEGTRP